MNQEIILQSKIEELQTELEAAKRLLKKEIEKGKTFRNKLKEVESLIENDSFPVPFDDEPEQTFQAIEVEDIKKVIG